MVEAEKLRALESELNGLKKKKESLDSEVLRHEIDLKNAEESLKASVEELKSLGFSTIKDAEDFLETSVKELNGLIKKANDKISGIVVE